MEFAYDNLNHRSPTLLGRTLKAALPGVRLVAAQTRPYAAWWRAQNLETLAERDPAPLWVVLGDSMSQGIGASSVQGGWVPRAQVALRDRGLDTRVLNLSFSGARTADVLERQLPALRDAAVEPDVVTLLIGSNDLLRRSLRAELLDRSRELLDALPHGTLVATTPGYGRLGEVATLVDAHPALVPVPLSFGRGEVAQDRFHPDDRAYARLARTFTDPLVRAVRQGTRSFSTAGTLDHG